MKIICTGFNYRLYVMETGKPAPEIPVIFLKPDSAILKNNKPFFLPDFSSNIQGESGIVIKISKLGKSIEPRFAHRYYDEVTAGIDITAGDIQAGLSGTGFPWELSKCFDGAFPLGRFLPVDMFNDRNSLDFKLEKNGAVVQHGNTADMIFSVDEIISFVSRFFTLKTGDLVFTGSPSPSGPLKRNDHLVAYIGDLPLLDFMIR